jgi:hypothetical protein
MTHLLNNFYAVQIPEGEKKFYITKTHGDWDLIYPNGFGSFNWIMSLPDNEAGWSIISTSEEMTNEQASEFVGRTTVTGLDIVFYENYETGDVELNTPLESFQSLLKSKSLEGRQLILKLDDGGNKT